jgi:hypothetical protein
VKLRFLPVALLVAAPRIAVACTSCYGDPSSSLTKGAKAAILVMLVVIGAVLGTIGHIAWKWKKRADELDRLLEPARN